MSRSGRRGDLSNARSRTFTRLLTIVLIAWGAVLGTPVFADQGCEDMRQLCKDATADADKCAKNHKGDGRDCKALIAVRDATCTQAEIVCKPPVGEAK